MKLKDTIQRILFFVHLGFNYGFVLLYLKIIMGNFCSSLEQNHISGNIIKKKMLSTSSTLTQEPNLNNLDLKQKQQKILLELLQKNRKVSIRQSCPPIKSLKLISQIGKGGQAQIFELCIYSGYNENLQEVQEKQTFLALKRIHLKSQKSNLQSILTASHLLLKNDSPFLMKGYFSCMDSEYLYEGINLAKGGDLSTFTQTTFGKGDSFRKLGVNGIRMVIAGIVLGLQYLHTNGLIYSDLKMENILIGQDGYPMLADFQLIKYGAKIPVQKFQGTVTYIGPQIYMSQTFDKGIDLWALGILIYVLTYNEYPFCKQQILDKNFVNECKKKESKYKLKRKIASNELVDLINNLLKINSTERLGYKSFDEIKNHYFFNGFPWKIYEKKKLQNPLKQIIKEHPLKRSRFSCT